MNWLRRIFYGRNGGDHLSAAFLILALFVLIASRLTGFVPLAFLYLACILYSLFRMLSKDIHNRRRENARFVDLLFRIKSWFKLRWRMVKEFRTHRYLKCPKCKTRLRVPKGKGKINIKCSKCGESMVKKV